MFSKSVSINISEPYTDEYQSKHIDLDSLYEYIVKSRQVKLIKLKKYYWTDRSDRQKISYQIKKARRIRGLEESKSVIGLKNYQQQSAELLMLLWISYFN